MEVIQNTTEKLIAKTEASESLLNAIRRSVQEIPVLAIDEVEIFKNDSALYDEVLVHRIGLISLRMEPKMSGKAEIDLKLSKTGPGIVYSGELKGNSDIVYDKMPIVLLEKEQELEFVATARLGKGTEHAKYSPGLFYYRSLVEIHSKNPHVEKIVHESRGTIKPERVKDFWLCDLNENIVEDIEKMEKDGVKKSNVKVMIIESFGQMDAKDILAKAIDALGENLEELNKAL